MNPDVRRIYAAQSARALAYGFGAVMLGVTLEARGWSGTEVGVLLTCVVAGTAILTAFVGTITESIGRRRTYASLYAALAVVGVVFAFTDSIWVLCAVALTGVLSTEVVESGPFTSIEQSMLPNVTPQRRHARMFANYNAIATLAGSFGALAAGGPKLLRDALPGLPADQRFFLAFVPVALFGLAFALALSPDVESQRREPGWRPPLSPESRRVVARLCALFAVDAFAGGFVVQSFIAYWLRLKFGVSIEVLGVIFFCVGILQTASFMAASRIAEHIGLLNTMVFTHIPSNLLLAAIPLAPSLGVAMAILFGRFALSQMDVPTRQAYIASLVPPEERTAAAAYTNTARYAVRPLGPLLAGAGQQIALGFPFFLAGTVKTAYDLALFSWFRRVPLRKDEPPPE
jgi:predicted MFS family arabinose efflux permease